MKCLLLLLLVSYASADKVVQTNSGPVKGKSLDTKNVDAFLGIPYAEPPVGKLRFARPVPKSPWTETFYAKELPVACVQCMMELMSKFYNESSDMNEDCLYLNLWVPRTESTLKPIMVFIHGGGFMSGSSNENVYDGANLAQRGDVIVASMNYRLGTLGFFSAFIGEASGSMGMYDQVLALRWIKGNAKHFGGDPDNIVIFGESAGAWSVSLHMVSPLSKNLFRRGILQSGAAVAPMYSNDNAELRMASQIISKHVGCATNDEDLAENPKKVVECMKNLPVEKIIEIDEVIFKKPVRLIPRVGDEFLPTTPTDLLRKGEFKDTEVLLGVTRDEGSKFVAFELGFEKGDIFGETVDVKNFNETLARKMVEPIMKTEHYAKIVENYFQRVKEESRYTYLNAVSDIIGDSLITCSTVFYADFQSLKKRPVYFYLFDYRPPTSKFPEWLGVPHSSEIPYVFGNPPLNTFSENEEKLSEDIMNFWIVFAKTGNPNTSGRLEWPKYVYDDPKFQTISMSDRLGVQPDNNRCEAWRKLYRSTIDQEVIQNFKNLKTEM